MFRRKNPSLGVLQAVGGVQMNSAFFMSAPLVRNPFVFNEISVCFGQYVRSFSVKRPFVCAETRVRFFR